MDRPLVRDRQRRLNPADAVLRVMGLRGGIEMNWEKIIPGVGGAIGGAIVLAIIGFIWGGWVTGGTAQKMAVNMAEAAVVDRLAPICVEHFNQDPKKDQKFQELVNEDSWKRGDYVENQGWATMPSEEKPDSKVAEKCADMLVQLGQ